MTCGASDCSRLTLLPPLFVQIARARTVKAHFIKHQIHENKEGKKVADIIADGVIGGVGLIPRKAEDDAKK